MSSNSIFSSVESEKRWALEIDKNFPDERVVVVDTPTSVFFVPKVLTQSKPEAYAPQKMGLGPYHHLQPELYQKMQKQKLAAVRRFLGPEKLHVNFQQVVDALIQFEPVLRSCYHQHLDLDIQTLARILAIDGLYLLQFLQDFTQMKEVAGDILMLENQIPFIVLKKIRGVLQLCPSADDDSLLLQQFQNFIQEHTPLQLNKQIMRKNFTQVDHLLQLMYHLIVNNRGIEENEARINMSFMPFSMNLPNISVQDIGTAAQTLVDRGLGDGSILSFVKNLPWGKILGVFKKRDDAPDGERVQEIEIPSVSRMSKAAGIQFSLIPAGIMDVKFEDSKKIFYLPEIKLSSVSEVILRNLIAYEAASAESSSSPLYFAQYVDLMCGIIDTEKDVEILKKEEIIKGELSNDEIVRVFNGINKSTQEAGEKSNIGEAVESVNTQYDNLFGVKVKRFLKKYVYVSWKCLSALITIAVLVLLILNAFCTAFGCGRWFGRNGVTQSHRFTLFSDQ